LGFGAIREAVEILVEILVGIVVGILVVPADRRVFGGASQRALHQLRHARDPRKEDFRVLRGLRRQPVPPQTFGQPVDRRLDVLHLPA